MKQAEVELSIERYSARAEKEDQESLLQKVARKLSQLEQHLPASLREVVSILRDFISMVSDKEFKLEVKSKLLIMGGLLYFVVPTDFVPDFVPFLGYIDDGIVLTAIARRVFSELQRFRAYGAEKSQKHNTDDFPTE